MTGRSDRRTASASTAGPASPAGLPGAASPEPTPEEPEVAALQAALAGEHAAVHGYGVAGAWLAGADQDRAGRDRDAHRARRDDLAELVADRGAVPVAGLAGYGLPFAVDGARPARRLAALVETRLAAVYADLVAVAESTPVRRRAVRTQVDAARRAARWGAEAVAFPGLPERP